MVTAIVVLSLLVLLGIPVAYRIGKAVQKSQSKKARQAKLKTKRIQQQPYTGLDEY